MGRNRDSAGHGLPPNLYCAVRNHGRLYYHYRNPQTGKRTGFGYDREAAISAAIQLNLLLTKGGELVAKAMSQSSSLPKTRRSSQGTVGELAKDLLSVVPTLTTRRGKRLSESVQANYKIILNQVIADREFGSHAVRVFGHPDDGPRLVRSYLASSLNTPSWYNTRLGAISRLFKLAVDRGLIVRNPCDPVKSLPTPEREVYVPDDAYQAITEKLASDFHAVYARCCDLIYLMSARVADALQLEESAITVFPNGGHTDEHGNQVVGQLLFQAGKNGVWVQMDFNEDMLKLIEWFRAYKRREGIVNPKLCIHPMQRAATTNLTVERAKTMTAVAIAAELGISNVAWSKRVKRYGLIEALAAGAGNYACSRDLKGKPITVAHLRDRFKAAKEAAGITEDYTLRDLRPKGLTDEAIEAGEATNKGGWRPGSSMPGRYVKLPVPVRTRNTLKLKND